MCYVIYLRFSIKYSKYKAGEIFLDTTSSTVLNIQYHTWLLLYTGIGLNNGKKYIYCNEEKKVGCKLHYKVIAVVVVPQRLIEKH